MDGQEGLIMNAKLSEQAERYDQMADCMKQVNRQGSTLYNVFVTGRDVSGMNKPNFCSIII